MTTRLGDDQMGESIKSHNTNWVRFPDILRYTQIGYIYKPKSVVIY